MIDSRQEAAKETSVAVESGEYYREALRWYSVLYHNPISQRAILIIIACAAGLITTMTVLSLFIALPMVETVSMIVKVPQSLDRVARYQPLLENPRQDPNQAIMNWFVGNFIEVRESYDIDKQERMHRRVWVLSADNVYKDYFNLYKSEASPTLLYERHTKRTVKVDSIRVVEETLLGKLDDSPAETVDVRANVKFIATEASSSAERKTAWTSDITFRYSKIHVDQITGEITPMQFKVTGYESKQLGLE